VLMLFCMRGRQMGVSRNKEDVDQGEVSATTPNFVN
jgi:hypothetical protein